MGAALTAAVTWWSLSKVSLSLRLAPGPFDIQGIVPVAYSVFAVVLGIVVGSMIRRVSPAMATTLAMFAAVRIVIAVVVRPHYMSPLSKPASVSMNAPAGAWLLSINRRACSYTSQPIDSGFSRESRPGYSLCWLQPSSH